jgi:hypothetical protein
MTNDFLYFENQYYLYFTEPKDVSDIKLINIHIKKLPNKDELENMTNKVYKDFFENLYEEIKNGKIEKLSKYIRFPCFVSVPGNYSTNYIEIIFYNEFENLFETNEKYIEYVKYLLNNLNKKSNNDNLKYNYYISHFILYNFVKNKNKKYLDLFFNLFYTNKMKNPIGDINSHVKEYNNHIYIDKNILELIKSYNLDEKKNKFLLKIFNNFDFHESNNIIYGNFEEWEKKFKENMDKEFLCCLFDSLSVFPEITIEIINNNKKIFEKFFKKGIFSEYFNRSLFIENIDLFEIKEHENIFNPTFFKKIKNFDNELLELIVNKLQS